MAYETYSDYEFIGRVLEETEHKAFNKMSKVRIKYLRKIADPDKYETLYISKIKLIWDKEERCTKFKIKYTTKNSDEVKKEIISTPYHFSAEFNY